jgi:hypothetical protein
MNTITSEISINDVDSTETALMRRQAEEAITELNSYELALVGGGGGAMILE